MWKIGESKVLDIPSVKLVILKRKSISAGSCLSSGKINRRTGVPHRTLKSWNRTDFDAYVRQTKSSMRPTSVLLYFTTAFVAIIFFHQNTRSQCIVQSSNGYQVEINPTPEALIKPGDCPWGYNFDVDIDYSVSFSGENVPASLYTLQGNLKCGNKSLFFDLPNSGGTGKTTTVSNPWNGNSDCASATLNSLDCHDIEMQVQGPGISWQIIDCNWSPLPIELRAFHAIEWDDGVRFMWTTASETNNDYFSVERSADGRDWVVVLRVDGAGNSSSSLDYEATDPEPLAGTSYYRLKQTDFDGQYSYSDAAAVTFDTAVEKKVLIFPNPTNGQITIVAGAEEMAGFAVYDLQGGDVTNHVDVKRDGENNHTADLSLLPSGAYTIRTTSNVGRVYKQ